MHRRSRFQIACDVAVWLALCAVVVAFVIVCIDAITDVPLQIGDLR